MRSVLRHSCGIQQTSMTGIQDNRTLDERTYDEIVLELARKEQHFAAILEAHGPPPFWHREPGFPALIHIILEQQVSLASALAAFERVQELTNPLTPENFLALTDEQLRSAYFSRQKIAYGRALSEALVQGDLDLNALDKLDDDAVRKELTRVKGVGPWTADIYLLIALRRADVWPIGDLGLVTAIHEVLELTERPDADELETLSRSWRPWRSVATRFFWHHYLSTKRRR